MPQIMCHSNQIVFRAIEIGKIPGIASLILLPCFDVKELKVFTNAKQS